MPNPNALQFHKKVTEMPSLYIQHHLFISHNLQNSEIVSNESIYRQFPYKSTLPVPISAAFPTKSIDPNLKYISLKDGWKKKIQIMKTSHKRLYEHKKIKEVNLKPIGSADVPLYLLKFTKLLRNDPDPFFDSYYNWYLSGDGNLCTTNLENTKYLVQSADYKLSVQRLNKNEIEDQKIGSYAKYDCPNKELIHETICDEISKMTVIGLRQKNKIHLVQYKDGNNPNLKLLNCVNTQIPITSFLLENFDNNMYYTTIDNAINLHNVDSNKTFQLKCESQETVVNNWSSIRLFDTNTIIQVRRKSLEILDRRKQYEAINTANLFLSDCDNITTCKMNLNPYYIFLGTTHNVYFNDLRFLKNNLSPVNKWTHGLKTSPLIISSEILENEEIVAVGSQNINELCLINNSKYFSEEKIPDLCAIQDDESYAKSWNTNQQTYLPYNFPCISETYKNAQRSGMCLDPTINLKKRFDMSRNGLTFCYDHILTLNSIGDIFSQRLIPEYETVTYESNENIYLQAWTDQLQKVRLPFTVSSQTNMNHLFTALKRQNNPKIKRCRSKGFLTSNRSWKKSLTGLNEYVDMWANELLSVWELDETKQGVDNLVPPPADTKFKIDSWMNQHLAFDDDY